jgi:hypothetical protein
LPSDHLGVSALSLIAAIPDVIQRRSPFAEGIPAERPSGVVDIYFSPNLGKPGLVSTFICTPALRDEYIIPAL